MQSYFYQPPLLKSSTKKYGIIREDGEVVGHIQRYFHSKIHRLIDSYLGRNNLIVRMKGMSSRDYVQVDAHTQVVMLKRPYYYLRMKNGKSKSVDFQAIQTNNIKINAKFIIKSDNNMEMIVQKDAYGWVRFFEESKEVAKVRSNINEKFKTYIKINREASVQTPLFYAVYQQLLYYISY